MVYREKIRTMLHKQLERDIDEFVDDLETHFGDDLTRVRLSDHLVTEMYEIYAKNKYGRSIYD